MKKFIGHITVDSGTVMVADPCYWVGSDEQMTWAEYCKEIGSKPSHVFEHSSGISGKGIMVGSFGGDGEYPVYLEEDENHNKRLVIEFGEQ